MFSLSKKFAILFFFILIFVLVRYINLNLKIIKIQNQEIEQMLGEKSKHYGCNDPDYAVGILDPDLKIIVNSQDCRVSWHLGEWSENETRVLKKLIKPGFQIVEIGANFGVFTLLMSKLVGNTGTIYAFEANPKIFNSLQQSIKLNHYDDRVRLFNVAISDHEYKGQMVFENENVGAGYIFDDKSDEIQKICQKSMCVDIQVKTLDQMLQNKRIDMLKMDIEGAEFWALKGAKKFLEENPNILIIMEWYPSHLKRNKIRIEEVVNFIEGLNFQVWKIIEKGLQKLSSQDLLDTKFCDLVLSRDEQFIKDMA